MAGSLAFAPRPSPTAVNPSLCVCQKRRPPRDDDCDLTRISECDHSTCFSTQTPRSVRAVPEASDEVLEFGFDVRDAAGAGSRPSSSGHSQGIKPPRPRASPTFPYYLTYLTGTARRGVVMAGTTSASVTDTYGAFLIGTYCALMCVVFSLTGWAI